MGVLRYASLLVAKKRKDTMCLPTGSRVNECVVTLPLETVSEHRSHVAGVWLSLVTIATPTVTAPTTEYPCTVRATC